MQMPMKAAPSHIPTFQLYEFFQSLLFVTTLFRATREDFVVKNSDEQIHHRGVLAAVHEHGSQLVQLFLAELPALAVGLRKLLDALAQNVLLGFPVLAHRNNPFVETRFCACGHHHGNHSPSLAPRLFVDYLQGNERKLMVCTNPPPSFNSAPTERPTGARPLKVGEIMPPHLQGVRGALFQIL